MGRKETFPHIVFINHVDMLPTQNLKLKNRELLKQFFFFKKRITLCWLTDMKSELNFLVKVSVNIRQLVLSSHPKAPHHTGLCRPGWKVPQCASHFSPRAPRSA